MFYVGTGKNAKEFRFDDTQVRLWEVTIHGQALILDHSMMAGQIVDVFQSYDGDGYIQVSDHDALRFEQR